MESLDLALPRIREAIRQKMQPGKPLFIAIDGPAASGKTTLGTALAREYPAVLVHMDDFFLPPALRTPERLGTPGGNVHWERVRAQVLEPLARGETAEYGVFDCGVMAVTRTARVEPAPVILVEGSYSLHPRLRAFYGLKVFLTLDPAEQLERIRRRSGEAALETFRTRWIPLEERYFSACGVADCADLVL